MNSTNQTGRRHQRPPAVIDQQLSVNSQKPPKVKRHVPKYRGTCQICGRLQMANGGHGTNLVAKHGYRVDGQFYHICPGADHLPFEFDNTVLAMHIVRLQQAAADQRAKITSLQRTSPTCQDAWVRVFIPGIYPTPFVHATIVSPEPNGCGWLANYRGKEYRVSRPTNPSHGITPGMTIQQALNAEYAYHLTLGLKNLERTILLQSERHLAWTRMNLIPVAIDDQI